MKLASLSMGEWITGTGTPTDLIHAVSGEKVGEANSEGLDFSGMLQYGRNVGGPALRGMTFHERGMMLKNLAKYLMECKDEFYKISAWTGATKTDSWIDIEGGIGTLFIYSGKGRREFPDECHFIDGDMEMISKGGTFVGQHICVPLEGVATHINAFNFPCWGMLEKLAPTWLAGVPAIVKPATITSYLTHRMVQVMLESGILPDGALQLICGGVGDLFEHLTSQDVVTFTGSAVTGRKLREHPVILDNNIRFNMEADSLNCSILGTDVKPGMEEFDLFVKEVAKEMTVKAGQKCTAIRRTIVPEPLVEDVIAALKKRLDKTSVLGDPSVDGVRMGPLVGRSQVEEVRERIEELKTASELVYGHPTDFEVLGADKDKGGFLPAVLLHCAEPLKTSVVHDVEAFGPVSTIMPYSTNEEAIELAKRGKGSLVGSLFTADDDVAREVVLGCASHHGRIVVLNRESAGESTGHGSPLPHLVHGGPGRAGGGEEMGGARGVMHYMQRTALQGSPTTLSRICNKWLKGAAEREDVVHPFRKYFEEIQVGDTLHTARRTITEADVVNFAGISGDYFYAHMDDIAAKESLFEKRVAHGYFVLSAAAGLFVDPAPGPVVANYGLDNLRFIEPVYIGDTIQVRFTCKEKARKLGQENGVVAWDVEVRNQEDVAVAIYTILTLVKLKNPPEEATA